MIGDVVKLFLIIGSAFGLLGGLMAYLIVYNEYMHHFPDKSRPRRMALRSGLFTFVFLLLTLLLVGWVLAGFGGSQF